MWGSIIFVTRGIAIPKDGIRINLKPISFIRSVAIFSRFVRKSGVTRKIANKFDSGNKTPTPFI
jgi:hypothetical protein